MRYQFIVEGHLHPDRRDWFDGMSLSYEASQTVLEGELMDDAAVYGVINRLRDFGLHLVEMHRVDISKDSNQTE